MREREEKRWKGVEGDGEGRKQMHKCGLYTGKTYRCTLPTGPHNILLYKQFVTNDIWPQLVAIATDEHIGILSVYISFSTHMDIPSSSTLLYGRAPS